MTLFWLVLNTSLTNYLLMVIFSCVVETKSSIGSAKNGLAKLLGYGDMAIYLPLRNDTKRTWIIFSKSHLQYRQKYLTEKFEIGDISRETIVVYACKIL